MRTPRQWFRDHQAWVERELHPVHDAQIRDLLEEREELLTEIRRLRMGNHPAGRGLAAARLEPTQRDAIVVALREALTERDAEHEGGEGA